MSRVDMELAEIDLMLAELDERRSGIIAEQPIAQEETEILRTRAMTRWGSDFTNLRQIPGLVEEDDIHL